MSILSKPRKYRILSLREIRQEINSRQVRGYEQEQLKRRAI